MTHPALCLCVSTGLFPPKHPEEHGVHVSPGQELHHQQGDEEPLSVLPPSEVLRSGNVQRVWVSHLMYTVCWYGIVLYIVTEGLTNLWCLPFRGFSTVKLTQFNLKKTNKKYNLLLQLYPLCYNSPCSVIITACDAAQILLNAWKCYTLLTTDNQTLWYELLCS